MDPFIGVALHAIGGLAAASFYLPLRKIKGWSWESYWLVQGVAAWLIVPSVAAWLTTPDLGAVLAASPASAKLWAFFFGALWGIGGLTFGLSMRYLGMSLGYALALGFCAAFGTIVPPVFAGKTRELLTTLPGLLVLAGVAVCLAGVAVCGYAGVLKEKELSDEEKRTAIKEFALTKGVLVAVFAGLMSACMSFAINAAEPIAEAAKAQGATDVFSNNPGFIYIMGGGFATNFLWCLLLNFKNKSLGNYFDRRTVVNYLLAASGGIIWFFQFFFYGMGTTFLAEYKFASWTIHMAFIIVFSNLWGLQLGEWKGSSSRTYSVVRTGLIILVLSTLIIGAANYFSAKG